MKVNEAKKILESVGYIVESFEDELRDAFITQCGEMVIGNEPIWRRYYNRIMKNPDMVQYISDARNDGLDADEIVEYLLEWEESLNEDFTMGVGAPIGADQGIPHSMQGCAVPMMRIGEPAPMGKIQKPHPHCPPPPPYRRPPIGVWPLVVVNNKTTTKKKKKKKKKKKSSKKKK